MPDSPTIRGQNLYRSDLDLQNLLRRIAPRLLQDEEARLESFGAWVGGEVEAQADYTNRFAPPRLETYDRDGAVANRLCYNPLYEAVFRDALRRGMVGLNHGPARRPFALTIAMGYLLSQSDISIHCPVTLTGAVAHVVDRFAPRPVKAAYLEPLLRMDGTAWTGGTWATEREGGSDLGATRTTARPEGGAVALSGLKWFASNAGSDVALATARPDGAPPGTQGLGLYLVPRVLDDGRLNHYRIRRLKPKLGTWGLATGEIELLDAFAVEVAPPPEGLRLMMEALEFSRIHNAAAAAGVQRRAFLEATTYARHRRAFGHPIAAYPMVEDILLDLQMQLEAGLALAFEAAQAFDAAQGDERARTWMRVATALAKYQTAEQAVVAASRAIEVLGGIGYTEDYATARLLRDAQVLPVWEGPPNIQALELLRLLGGRHGGFPAFRSRLAGIAERCQGAAADALKPVQKACEASQDLVGLIARSPEEGPRHARRLLTAMADILAAGLLLEQAAHDLDQGDARKLLVARRFVQARLAPRGGPLDEVDGIPPGQGSRVLGYAAIAPGEAGLS